MSAIPDDFSIFGLRPLSGADKKMGGRAEAGRPKGVDMRNVNTATLIPQSIATTITMFDGQERERVEREVAAASAWLDERMSRARREVFSESVTISPVLAGLILHRNPDNRRVSKRLVQELRADLENGNWVFNGESVIISNDGLLNDGQHRLTACRDSGVPIRTLIVFGVPRSARLTTDQGKARTVGDYLSMGGYEDDAIVSAAVARLLWQYNTHGSVLVRNAGYGQSRARQPTKSEVQGTAIDFRAEIKRSLSRVKKGNRSLGGHSLIAFCHLVFSRHDSDAADFFIDRLIDGSNVSGGHPVHTLRERLLRDTKLQTPDRFEAIVRAWNAMRENRDLDKIQIMGRAPKIER